MKCSNIRSLSTHTYLELHGLSTHIFSPRYATGDSSRTYIDPACAALNTERWVHTKVNTLSDETKHGELWRAACAHKYHKSRPVLSYATFSFDPNVKAIIQAEFSIDFDQILYT